MKREAFKLNKNPLFTLLELPQEALLRIINLKLIIQWVHSVDLYLNYDTKHIVFDKSSYRADS